MESEVSRCFYCKNVLLDSGEILLGKHSLCDSEFERFKNDKGAYGLSKKLALGSDASLVFNEGDYLVQVFRDEKFLFEVLTDDYRFSYWPKSSDPVMRLDRVPKASPNSRGASMFLTRYGGMQAGGSNSIAFFETILSTDMLGREYFMSCNGRDYILEYASKEIILKLIGRDIMPLNIFKGIKDAVKNVSQENVFPFALSRWEGPDIVSIMNDF